MNNDTDSTEPEVGWRGIWSRIQEAFWQGFVTLMGATLTALPHVLRSAVEQTIPESGRVSALCWSLSILALCLTLNALQYLHLRHLLRLRPHPDGGLVDGRGKRYCQCEGLLVKKSPFYPFLNCVKCDAVYVQKKTR